MLFLQTKGLALLAAASAAFTLFAGRGRRGVQRGGRVWSAPRRPSSPRCCSSGGRRSCCASGSSCRSAGNYLGHTAASRALAVVCIAGRRRDGGDRDPPARSAADRGGRRAGGAGRQHAAQHGAHARRGELVPAGRVRAAGAAAIRGAPPAPGAAPMPAKFSAAIDDGDRRRGVRGVAGHAGRPAVLQGEHALRRLHPPSVAQPLPAAARRRRPRDLRRAVHAGPLLRRWERRTRTSCRRRSSATTTASGASSRNSMS